MNQLENETICEKLLNDLAGVMAWKWDDGVETLLAEFNTDKEFKIRTIIEKYLPILWDVSNIHNAPQGIQEVYKHLGKLRPTQLLFSSDPISEDFVFCAWWPWDNGQKVSLRIAPFNKRLAKAEKDKLMARLAVLAGL